MLRIRDLRAGLVACAPLLAAACGGDGETAGRGGGPPEGGFGAGGNRPAVAVPVEVTAVERRDIASYIETNGTLEAEAEVDIVARTAGPIVELAAEENMAVRAGQLLARIDQDEIRARLEVSRVALEEAQTAFDRTEALQRANLLSTEEFEQARSRLDSARAEFAGNEILFRYTEIRAPFSGLIVRRYVKFAESVTVNQPLFRISDFDPLLCPIQVPERELSRLAAGQRAYVTVDAWPGERFAAGLLRISPVVDAATGTIKVTLEVEARGKLRPGMFASVFLQTDTHEGALVIPRSALALDSIGDAVFVAADGTARRRDVTLGVREGDAVEILAGLAEGEPVVSVGQDSLSDGTPIEILDPPGEARTASAGAPPQAGLEMTAERRAEIEARMRARGMSDEEIAARLAEMGARSGGAGEPAAPPRADPGGPGS
ncbi:MAG: efflux RND transporter periplasmic adaptor subunit [Acidobacteriota bacterium]|nr:efflux RND transporter periplasmic adaptor subunit [Acidobacteriota bacterium]